MKTLEQIVSLLLGFEVTKAKPGDIISMQAIELARFYEACRAEALEEEAKVAEEIEDQAWALWKTAADPHDQGRSMGAASVAQAIRDMK